MIDWLSTISSVIQISRYKIDNSETRFDHQIHFINSKLELVNNFTLCCKYMGVTRALRSPVWLRNPTVSTIEILSLFVNIFAIQIKKRKKFHLCDQIVLLISLAI